MPNSVHRRGFVIAKYPVTRIGWRVDRHSNAGACAKDMGKLVDLHTCQHGLTRNQRLVILTQKGAVGAQHRAALDILLSLGSA